MLKQILDLSNYYLNPYAIPVILVSILISSIGVFVLKQNKRSLINTAFSLQCFSVSFWLFTISIVYLSRIAGIALFWYRYFTFLGVVNIMPSVYLFAAVWSGEIKRKRRFVFINYMIPFIFYILTYTTNKFILPYDMRRYFWGFYPIYRPWLLIFLLFFSAQFFIGFRMLYSSYRAERESIKKAQLKIVTLATLIAFTASVDFLPKFFYFSLYPFGYISMLTYIILVGYSIVRYKTFDIETVIHKTAMWLLTFSFTFIPIVLVYRLVFRFIDDSVILQIGFWMISFILITIYLRIAQPRIDHLFQRRRANLEEIYHRFIEDLVHLKGLNQLIQRIEDTIADTLYPQRIDIFIYHEQEKIYKLANVVRGSREITELKSDNLFLFWLAKEDRIVYREFIDIDPAYARIKENAKNYFHLTEAMVAIPLVLNEKLLGVVNLGKKANLRRYSAVDFYFLAILKSQSTIAIANSLLYENIEEQVRQRTKELVEVQKQLVQAEKLATVGTLAGGVAHEINNPLTAILTNVQMLLSAQDIDAKLDRESLELIEEATKRCRTIVQKLMAYARRPLENMEVSEVNLLDALNKAASFLTYQLEQENIKIIIEAKQGHYLVTGNHNELEQVVTNLILNAKDAIRQVKKGGDIHISLLKSGDWIKMIVRDEGGGIPKEIMSKIFDPFFTTKDVGKGLGLGLPICQSIVEKHNGIVTVESEPRNGSVFTVQLPQAGVRTKTDKAGVSKGR